MLGDFWKVSLTFHFTFIKPKLLNFNVAEYEFFRSLLDRTFSVKLFCKIFFFFVSRAATVYNYKTDCTVRTTYHSKIIRIAEKRNRCYRVRVTHNYLI